MMENKNIPDNKYIDCLIAGALREDLGKADITTDIVIRPDAATGAFIITKEDAVLCGLDIAAKVFKALDKNIKISSRYKDSDKAKAGSVILKVIGKARAILSAERTALNFLSHLSGIATKTNEFVKRARPYKAKIFDTRKTSPGLRTLEKYAVKCGGGQNHRFGLWDMVLVKDNHKSISKKTVGDLVYEARKKAGRRKVEIEIENLKEFEEALTAGPDVIMLDNMSISDIKKAVSILRSSRNKARIKLEVSGNVDLGDVKPIAKTGVDIISVGSITHSASAIDMSLEID